MLSAIDRLHREQVRRHDLDAVVVRLGVVRLRLFPVEVGPRRDGALLGEQTGVLEDRGGLNAVRDQLDGSDLRVLPRDDRHRRRCGERRTVAGVLQRGEDAPGESVIRRQNTVDARAVVVGGRQQVLHAPLRGLLLPAQDGGLLDRGLTTLDDQRPVIDLRLEHRHGAVPEEERVVVVEGTGEQLDVERPGGRTRGAVGVQDAQTGQQGIGLRHAHLEVVERDVEVDVLAVANQPVVGDDRNVLVGRGLQLRAQRRTVDGRDDQRVCALGDHLIDLLRLSRDVIVRELQVDLVAGLLQLFLDRVAVGDPPFRGLGRHRHADQQIFCRLVATAAAPSACPLAATGGQSQGQQGARPDRCEPSSPHVISSREVAAAASERCARKADSLHVSANNVSVNSAQRQDVRRNLLVTIA